jgi:site-specific DNA-methyltransferase (adenine-specific)
VKPYYDDGLATIYLGDCREFLPGLSGTMITDPPFNIGYHYKSFKDKMNPGEYLKFLSSVLFNNLVLIHYPEDLFRFSSFSERTPEKVVAWVYNSNQGGKAWRSIAWFGVKPNFKLVGQPYKNPKDKRVKKLIEAGRQARLYDWWEVQMVKNVSKEKTSHPCQMPFEVMRRVVGITPLEGGAFIDPFMGSGTTLVASKAAGKKCVGIELDESYCEIAAKRLSAS